MLFGEAMLQRNSRNYLEQLIREEWLSVCSHHLELFKRFKEAEGRDELLKLLSGYPELRKKVKEPESLSLEELKEAIAHGIVELIYEEKEERIKRLR